MTPPSRLVRYAGWAWLGHVVMAGGITASQSLLAIALLLCIAAWLRHELRSPWHRILLPMALYVAASWISAFASPRPLFALDQANEWFHFSSFAVGLALMRTDTTLRDRAVVSFAGVVGVLGALGLWQYFVLGHRTLEQRITGTAAHVMTFSGLMLVGALFLGVIALEKRSRICAVAAAVAAFALVLTFTRGAWIGWTAGALAWLALRRPRWIAWSVPVLLVLLVLSPMSIFGRLVSAFDTEQASNLDRIRMAQSGWEMIVDDPLSGVGPGQLKATYPLYRAEDAPRFRTPHLHNNPLQVWAERGLAALMAAVAIFIVAWRGLWRFRADPDRRVWCDAGLAAITGFVVAGMFEFNFGDTEVVFALLNVLTIAFWSLERPDVPLNLSLFWRQNSSPADAVVAGQES